jgi:hypothetical protein
MPSETRVPRAFHIPVSCAVEGDTDEAVVRKLAATIGVEVCEVFVRHGKAGVLKALPGLNSSAKGQPWFVLVDLDGDAPCAGSFVREQLPTPSSQMRFRVAVRAVEAWLLADSKGFGRFFDVKASDLPNDPESVSDPKETVIELARRSGRRIVRERMPPRPGSGRRTGDLYTALLIEFARDAWSVSEARARSSSLDRAFSRFSELGKR